MNPNFYNPLAPLVGSTVKGLSKRGANAFRGGTLIGGQLPTQQQMQQRVDPQASFWGSAMDQGPPMLGQMMPWMRGGGPAQPQPPAARPPAQAPAAQAPANPMLQALQGMSGGGARLEPNMKALIDAMTGARVHKGMDGRQLGMEGVDPNIKYMLYAMRGRRHKGMQGQDIY